MATVPGPRPGDLRDVARKRVEAQRGFVPHLIAYVCVNAGLVVIWATASGGGFFWPGFVLGFWGMGLVMHAWSAFLSRPVTEEDVERELRRMQRR